MTNGKIRTDWVETVSQDGLHLMQTRLEVRVPTSEGRKFITCGLARKTYVVRTVLPVGFCPTHSAATWAARATTTSRSFSRRGPSDPEVLQL
ncbi:hypothetical protein Sros01_82490 [Streptomyces roseochromogenus]|nr:hypothetical protein Sros01_82490 [Streptomyces roseochromogenus]